MSESFINYLDDKTNDKVSFETEEIKYFVPDPDNPGSPGVPGGQLEEKQISHFLVRKGYDETTGELVDKERIKVSEDELNNQIAEHQKRVDAIKEIKKDLKTFKEKP